MQRLDQTGRAPKSSCYSTVLTFSAHRLRTLCPPSPSPNPSRPDSSRSFAFPSWAFDCWEQGIRSVLSVATCINLLRLALFLSSLPRRTIPLAPHWSAQVSGSLCVATTVTWEQEHGSPHLIGPLSLALLSSALRTFITLHTFLWSASDLSSIRDCCDFCIAFHRGPPRTCRSGWVVDERAALLQPL